MTTPARWPLSSVAPRLESGPVIAALLVGLLAGVTAVVVATEVKYFAFMIVGWLVAMIFVFSGNFRLACLCSLVLLAPLRLGQPFHIIPHMGGAAAFWIDGIDALMAVLLWYQLRDRRLGRREPMRMPPALWLWVGMIGLGVISVALAPYRMTALQEVVRMLKLLLLCFVLLNELTRPRQFQIAFVTLMIGVIFNSLLAIAQWALSRDFGLSFLGEGTSEGFESIGTVTLITREFVFRPGGLMGAGNLFAAYLAMLVPMAVALFLSPVSRSLRFLSACAVAVALPALVLTLSRSGWLSFGAGFLCVLAFGLWHPASRRLYMPARAAIITLVVLVGMAMSPMIITRIYNSDPNAGEVRLEWLETARLMVVDNPVLGVGLNKYVFRQLDYSKQSTPEEMNARYGSYWPVVHSTWAVTWAEQGTVGFLLFLGMHLLLIRVGIANLRIRDPMMHAIGAGLLAGLLALMVDGGASFFVRMEQHARVFWLVVAMLLAVGYWRRQNEDTATAPASVAPNRPAPASPGLAADRTSGWLPVRGNALKRNADASSALRADRHVGP